MVANRRQLLVAGLGLSASCALTSSAFAASLALPKTTARSSSRAGDLFSISLAEWSLHRTLRSGDLENLGFPAYAKQQFGIEAVEYVNSFFKDKATDFEYLRELRQRAGDAGVKNLLIMIDGEGQLADEDDGRRRSAIENHFRWIAAAAFLGCHSIRVNAGGGGTPQEQMDRAADSLARLGAMGDQYDINVIVENHGGWSSNGAWLAAVMKKADHPRVGTLPDFGNFRIAGDEWYDRYQGVRELMPFAKAVSAKSHEFDAAGNETKTDYRKMMRIVLEAGYRGYVGVEYEGGGMNENQGILATKALLETVRAELAEEF